MTNAYPLGRLAPGNYGFQLRNFGSNILLATFTVAPPPDADGDGVSDADEALADTNPNDPTSALRFTSIRPVPGGMRIAWQGGVLATQILQRASSLGLGSITWTNIFTNRPPTTTQANRVDPIGTAQNFFYRIRAER